jgi:hypothetical protein
MIPVIRAIFGLALLFEFGAAIFQWERDFDFTWLGLAVTLAVVWLLLERFSAPSWIWAAALFLLVLDALSAFYLLYTRIYFWDYFMHALGGGLVAAGVLNQVLRRRRRPSLQFAAGAVYLIVAAVGFCYEFLEYLVDRFYFGYPRTLVSAYNTIEDQVFNLAGTTLVIAGYYAWTRHRAKGVRHFEPLVAHASGKEKS